MKPPFRYIFLPFFLVLFTCSPTVWANCKRDWGPSAYSDVITYVSPTTYGTPYTYEKRYKIRWNDNHILGSWPSQGTGMSYTCYLLGTCYCEVQYYPPWWEVDTATEGDLISMVTDGSMPSAGTCVWAPVHYHRAFHQCNNHTAGTFMGYTDYDTYPTTGCAEGFMDVSDICDRSSSFIEACNQTYGYDPDTGDCYPPPPDPIYQSDPPYCSGGWAYTDWYESFDSGYTWYYQYSNYSFYGDDCYLIIQ